jgi:hypothetical protein
MAAPLIAPPMMAPFLLTPPPSEASGASPEAADVGEGVADSAEESVDDDVPEDDAVPVVRLDGSDVDDWVDESVDDSVDAPVVEAVDEPVVEPVDEPVDESLAVPVSAALDWLARVMEPKMVGSDSVLGAWSMGAETLTTTGRATDWPDAVGATVAAMLDAEPQPYWKLPPSNWFW